MDIREQHAILSQLIRMDPGLEDADFEEQYRRCHEVTQQLDDWTNYTLVELIDAVTWGRRWYWRRKS